MHLPTSTQIRSALRAPWDPATLVAVALLALVLAMWLGRIAPAPARADGEAVDSRAVDAPLARVREAWAAEFAALRDGARRLAVDDDTYEFVRRPNFPYVDEHYSPAHLASLAVDTVLIADRNAKPLFWRRPNDPDNRGFEDACEFLAQLPPLPPVTERRRTGEPVLEGVVTFHGTPSLVTAIAIEPASGRGDPRGWLIHGRALTGALAKRLAAAVPPGVEAMPGTDPQLPAPVRQRLDRSLHALVVADEHRVHGYLPVVDLGGRLVRVYAAQAQRPAHAAATHAVAGPPQRSWSLVAGASLLLLLVGACGYAFAFAPGRRTRTESREQIERLARALADEARGGPVPAHVSSAPELPQVAVAEALARLGEPPEDSHESDWLRRMPATFAAYRGDDGAAGFERPSHAAMPAPHLSSDDAALAPGPESADEHEWLVGTPDVLLDGADPAAVSTSLAAADAAEALEASGRATSVADTGADRAADGPACVDAGYDLEAAALPDTPADEYADLEIDIDADVVADTDAGPETDVVAAADAGTETDVVAAADVIAGAGADVAADAVADEDAVAEADAVAVAHADVDVETDVELDVESDVSVDLPSIASDGVDRRDLSGADDECNAVAERAEAANVADAPDAADAARPAAAAAHALVRRLLDTGRMRVHYQPQFDTSRGEIVAVDAAVRWTDDSGVAHDATELLGDAADAAPDVTEFVVRRACADRREWSRQFGREVTVGVRVGLAELRDPAFVGRVLGCVAAAGVPVGAVELEVPETAIAGAESAASDTLESAYRRGLGIAIGGFFASDAPLRALMRVPVGKLKIHRSLIADLPDDDHARTVVDAALAIGRTLGVAVCAEGVEAAAQAEYLEDRGCALVQGAFYSPPLEAEQVGALLRRSGTDTVRLPLMSVEQLEAHARTAGMA